MELAMKKVKSNNLKIHLKAASSNAHRMFPFRGMDKLRGKVTHHRRKTPSSRRRPLSLSEGAAYGVAGSAVDCWREAMRVHDEEVAGFREGGGSSLVGRLGAALGDMMSVVSLPAVGSDNGVALDKSSAAYKGYAACMGIPAGYQGPKRPGAPGSQGNEEGDEEGDEEGNEDDDAQALPLLGRGGGLWHGVSVSENLVSGRKVRVVGLPLPPAPDTSSSFYAKSLRKNRDWDVWLRVKVHAAVRVLWQPPLKWEWFVMLDDDT